MTPSEVGEAVPRNSTTMRNILFRLICSFTLVICAASSLRADVIYAITNDDNLITFNSSNPAGATLVGTLDTVPAGGSASLGIFFNGNSLYVYDTNNNVLRQINPDNALTIATINLGLANAPGEGDVAFHNGVGYLASTLQPDGSFSGTGTLFKFTLTANSATVVTTAVPQLDGLAFSPTGVLYGLAQGGGALYTIDPTTGAATEVGTGTGITGSLGFGGLTFGPSGDLFASLSDFSDPSEFFDINPITGTGTLVDTIPYDQVSGLTTSTLVAISPEPASFVLVAFCLLSGVAVLRRSRANAAA